LNRQAVNATRDDELIVEDGIRTFGESEKSKRRKTMSVFNTTEKLNKHPSVYLNYLRVLVEGKGMKWQAADEEAPPKPPQTNYKLTAIMNALDIDNDVFEDIGLRKKMGKTTTDENFQWEKMFWKRYFSVEQLDETVLRNFMFGNNPLKNFLSLIDLENYEQEDNLKCSKQAEKVALVKKLIEGLGFASPVDTST